MDPNLLNVISLLINSILVLVVVQFIKKKLPVINERWPWAFPILAGAIGPAIAALQTYLSKLLGIPIDLSPIAAIFSGGTAVAIHQVQHQVVKVRMNARMAKQVGKIP